MSSDRRSPRDQREQLVTLLNGWDPAGRLASGAPRNVYEPLVDPLLDLVSRKASSEEIGSFLDRELRDRFRHEVKGADQFVKKLLTWSEMESVDQGE